MGYLIASVAPFAVVARLVAFVVDALTTNTREAHPMSTTNTFPTTSTSLAALRSVLTEDDAACPRCAAANDCPAWCVEQDTPTLPARRVFGRCPLKGCQHRAVVDADITPGAVRMGTGISIREADGTPRSIAGELNDAVAARLGLACPDHGYGLDFRALRGKINHAKVCDARCTMAKGPDCECACGGELHGRDRAA